MKHLASILRGSILSLVMILASSGCLQTPPSEPIPTQTAVATQTRAATTPLPTTTSQPSPTVTTLPSPTSQAAIFELGEPFWLGRGKVRHAAFLPGAEQIVIAWGSGISLHQVEGGEELWFQALPANLVAFDTHPLGERFAAALSDGSLLIFEASDGNPINFAGAQPNAYWGDLAWSPDGETIAFQFIGARRSDPIYLLKPGNGQLTEIPDSQTREGVAPVLVWSPDSRAITVASLGENCARFVDRESGAALMSLGQPGQCYPHPPLLFLPGGQAIAVNNASGGVDWLDFPSGEHLRTLPGTGGRLVNWQLEFPAASASLFIDPAGQWIASRGGYEPCYCGNPEDQPYHPLIVWDLESGAVQAQLERAVESLAQRHRLAAAFDGEEILMFYDSGEITRWAFTSSNAEEIVAARIPSRPVSAWTLRFSTDGSHLAFEGYYGADIYDIYAQQLVQRFNHPLESPALNPDGSLVALYNPQQRAVEIYVVQSGNLLTSLPASPVLMGAAFSPDGRYLAYATDSAPIVFNLASAESTLLDTGQVAALTGGMRVTKLLWSPDGRALVTVFGSGGSGADSGQIVLWKRLDGETFAAVYAVPNVEAYYAIPNLVLASFNPSGSRVALKSLPVFEAGQTQLVIYDLAAGEVLNTFDGYDPGAWVNEDELLAAQAQFSKRLTRLNVVTGETTVGGGVDRSDTAYAPGGIFTAELSNPPQRGITVRHWQTGSAVAEGLHEALNLLDYRWSPDGSWLVSAGDDGTLRVWPVVIP